MDDTRARAPWSRRRWVLVIGSVLVALALVAAWFAFRPGAGGDNPATEVARATRGDQTTTVSLSGVLSPQQQANVSFGVPGTVRRIHARVGDQVRAGQELATLEDRDLRNALSLAEAQLAAARAQLQTVRDAAQASSAQVAAARAQVASAQAGVDQASARVDEAVLVSPLDGVVAEVAVEVGDQVAGTSGLPAGLPSGAGSRLPPGMAGLPGLSGSSSASGGAAGGAAGTGGAAIVVVVPGAWQLDATVGTVDLPALEPGQQAVVTPTGTSTRVSAVVDTVGIVATGSSGQAASFPVTLRVTDTSVPLFSGSDADAVVTTAILNDVLTIPDAALWFADEQATVRRPGAPDDAVAITIGRRFGDRVEVTGGLADGDEVLARKGVTVSAPPRPEFGPNGRLASPDPSPSPRR